MIGNELNEILCCPKCGEDLVSQAQSLDCLRCQKHFPIVDGIPIFHNHNDVSHWDVNIANDKWNEFYKGFDWEGGRESYSQSNLPYIYRHMDFKKNDYFLEIGGGPSYLSFDVTGKVKVVVIVDFDLDILKLAKAYFEKYNKKAYFVCANVNQLPFKRNTFDSSVGIGVIEHTERVLQTVEELEKVTKKGGYTFQTVPFFSFLTLINNSLRFGSFTSSKIINWFIWLFHIKLLKSRYMAYGYEELYTENKMLKTFKAANFRKINIGFYDYNQSLLKRFRLLNKLTRKLILTNLFGMKPFADIIYIRAEK